MPLNDVGLGPFPEGFTADVNDEDVGCEYLRDASVRSVKYVRKHVKAPAIAETNQTADQFLKPDIDHAGPGFLVVPDSYFLALALLWPLQYLMTGKCVLMRSRMSCRIYECNKHKKRYIDNKLCWHMPVYLLIIHPNLLNVHNYIMSDTICSIN